MALDPANYIEDLDPTEPVLVDPAGQADDHIRAIKKAIRQSWAGGDFGAALSPTIAVLEALEGRLATLEGVTVPTIFAPVIGHLTKAAGSTAVTGVGFAPQVVLIMASFTTSAYMTMSIGAASQAFRTAGSCLSVYSDVDNPADDRSEDDTTSIYKLYGTNTPGNPLVKSEGAITSFDADGFTINGVTATVSAELIWMAFQ